MGMRYVPTGDIGHHARTFRAFTACLSAVCVFSVAPRATVIAATVPPSLSFATRSGHSLAVAGKNWGHHVVLTARIGDAIGGAVFGSLAGGRFTVALDFSVACGGITVEARDFRGGDATIRRAGPLCPNRLGERPPSVSILQGSRNTPRIRSLRHPSAPRTLILHLGDALQITEPGGFTPSFTPTADTPHFVLLAQGVRGSAVCTQGPCGQTGDQYWKWIAVKRGRATVSLSPACRQSRPPCEIRESVIDITIET
jgi:hypothetical protein